MLIKTSLFLLSVNAYTVFSASCGNHGAARCLQANGISQNYVKCEYGVEVEYECESGNLCYGSGTSGVMCIEKPLASKRQSESTSTFGGYESSIIQLIEGFNGNVNSLNAWLISARSAMFIDKNAIYNVAVAMNKGMSIKSTSIGNGINNLKNLRTTPEGQTTIINNARKFMTAAIANKNDIGYFMSDVSNNAAISDLSRQGLSSMITNLYATGKNPITAAGQNSVINALNNLRAITTIYQPRTFGSIFRGGLLPATVGPQLYKGANGDYNSTDAMVTSMLSQLKGRTSGMSGFYAASVVVSNNVARNINPNIIATILNRYRSKNTSGVGLADTINGIANVFSNINTRYNSQVTQIVRAYSSDSDVLCPGCETPPDCGCTDDNFNALVLAILLLVASGLIGAPTTSCCYSSSNLFASRSLVA
ncbi:hypothetical protein AYI69_g5501 [Smittium culicis]|uniref:Uncharacterized protein n=1 Tax=Smittium culicis TaxID=133412 RepID=A0A1R1Y5U8_9FUNG|nr:hypothetical protein AYI69_g5501 [Smittium culicis]